MHTYTHALRSIAHFPVQSGMKKVFSSTAMGFRMICLIGWGFTTGLGVGICVKTLVSGQKGVKPIVAVE